MSDSLGLNSGAVDSAEYIALLDARIADLEKQLAEKDARLKQIWAMFKTSSTDEENRLRKQLAEKDKEIERMRPVIDSALGLYRSNSGISSMKFFRSVQEYEQSTKSEPEVKP